MTKLDFLTLSVSLLAKPFTYFLKLIVHSYFKSKLSCHLDRLDLYHLRIDKK